MALAKPGITPQIFVQKKKVETVYVTTSSYNYYLTQF